MANIYVDFSAANDGDGTTAAQAGAPAGVGAFNTLAGKTFTSGDFVWIRKKSKTITVLLTISTGPATFVGWPESGDLYYSTRPASGTSNGWDADATGYAEITATTAIALVTFTTVAGSSCHRMKFNLAYTGTSAADKALDIVTAASGMTFYTCIISHSGTSTGANAQRVLAVNSLGCKFKACTVQHVGTQTVTSVAASNNVVYIDTGATSLEFDGCTITSSRSLGIANAAVVVSLVASGVTAFLNSSITETGTASIATAFILSTTAGNLVVLDTVTIDDTGVGDTVRVIAFNVGGHVHAQNVTMNKGGLVAFAATSTGYFHFAKYDQKVASSTYAISMAAGAVVTIAGINFTAKAGNTSGDIQVNNGCMVILNNVTLPHATPFGTIPENFQGAYLSDYGGTLGAFQYWGPGGRGRFSVSSVTRTGGEAASYKIEGINVGGTVDIWSHGFSMLRYGAQGLRASVTAGARTITIYGYHKNYSSDPLDNEIWAETEYLAGASGAVKTLVSTRSVAAVGAALTSDSSTWTGDSGMTKFKLVISFTAGQDCVVPIRIRTKRAYSASAYFMIDPKAVVA